MPTELLAAVAGAVTIVTAGTVKGGRWLGNFNLKLVGVVKSWSKMAKLAGVALLVANALKFSAGVGTTMALAGGGVKRCGITTGA